MIVSLDTNIWIFGFLEKDLFCEKILLNLNEFDITMPYQIRAELERNLSPAYMKRFYLLALETGVQFDFEPVPQKFLSMYAQKGLKKGDWVIGAFCEWRKVDIIVSNNRDFLRGLTGSHFFRVLSPREFCEKFDLA